MSSELIITLGQETVKTTLMLAAPLLISALVVGLLVSIFQAVTQINEATLSFIPKLICMFGVMVLAGPWMLATMVDFMRRLITGIPGMIG